MLKRKKNNKNEQASIIKSIAKMEICNSSLNYKFALDILTHNATGIKAKYNVYGGEAGFIFDVLKSDETIQKLIIYNVISGPMIIYDGKRTLARYMSDNTSKFIVNMNTTLAKYTAFIDKELIKNTSLLINSNITRRLARLDGHTKQILSYNGKGTYPALWDHEKSRYLNLITTLQAVLESTGYSGVKNNNSALGCSLNDNIKDII